MLTGVRAVVLRAPYAVEVTEVPAPTPGPGEVAIDVERAGVCGTDVEFFTGEMAYLATGHARFPARLGHEWCGRVAAIGPNVDESWLGRRVTGDTMIGCTRCDRCRAGRHHLCEQRFEVGIRGGWPGALAEQLSMPARSLRPVPESITPAAAALVEPGGNALRAVRATEVGAGDRLLVLGAGTIGLLCLLFGAAAGADVAVCDIRPQALGLAAELGARWTGTPNRLGPAMRTDAVIDASTGADSPTRAVELVDPGGRVVYIGIAGGPSLLDTRAIVLNDLTVVGILGASAGLDGAIEAYAAGAVRPDPLVAEVVGLDRVGAALRGERSAGAGPGPKIQVDPRR